MRIGLIGPGKVGKGLADRWFRRGHEILFSFSRSEEKLRAYAAEYGAQGHWGTPRDAVQFGDAVVLCCKWEQLRQVVDEMGPIDNVPVIETINAFTKTGELKLGNATSVAEELANMAPGALVVPAFNSVPATLLSEPEEIFGNARSIVFYCGDDTGAKAIASTLIEDAGFHPIDVGPLDSARLIEPYALLTILAAKYLKTRNIGFALLRPEIQSSSEKSPRTT